MEKSHSELPIQDGEWGEGGGRVAAGMFVQQPCLSYLKIV